MKTIKELVETRGGKGLVEALEKREKGIVSLLEAAKCPDCDGSGSYLESYPEDILDEIGHDHWVKCLWCDEVDRIIKMRSSTADQYNI